MKKTHTLRNNNSAVTSCGKSVASWYGLEVVENAIDATCRLCYKRGTGGDLEQDITSSRKEVHKLRAALKEIYYLAVGPSKSNTNSSIREIVLRNL